MAMVLQSFQRNECIFPEKIPQSFFFALLCLLKGIENSVLGLVRLVELKLNFKSII